MSACQDEALVKTDHSGFNKNSRRVARVLATRVSKILSRNVKRTFFRLLIMFSRDASYFAKASLDLVAL